MKYVLFLLLAGTIFAAEPFFSMSLNDESLSIGGDGAGGLKAVVRRPEMVSWKTGRKGQAVFFAPAENQKAREVHGCISVEKKGKLDFTRPFTLMVWVCPDMKLLRETQHEVVSDVHGDRGPGFRLMIGWDCLTLLSGDGKSSHAISSTPSKHPIVKGVWNHLAMTWDGRKAAIYLNGTKVAESDESKDFVLLKGGDTLYIGAYRGGYAYGFPGGISDLKVYPGAMSDKEIMILAKEIVQ